MHENKACEVKCSDFVTLTSADSANDCYTCRSCGRGTSIVAKDAAPAPVHRVVRDLQGDPEKVYGVYPPILSSLSAADGKVAMLVRILMVASVELFRRTAAQGNQLQAIESGTSTSIPKLNRVVANRAEIFLRLPKRKPPVLQ